MRERLLNLIDTIQDYGEQYNPALGFDDYVSNSELAKFLLDCGVIAPPVKVRQKVWLIGYTVASVEKTPCMIEGEVYTITISELNYKLRGVFKCRAEINGEGVWFSLLFDDVGKTVFTTKEEAERALVEMEK